MADERNDAASEAMGPEDIRMAIKAITGKVPKEVTIEFEEEMALDREPRWDGNIHRYRY